MENVIPGNPELSLTQNKDPAHKMMTIFLSTCAHNEAYPDQNKFVKHKRYRPTKHLITRATTRKEAGASVKILVHETSH